MIYALGPRALRIYEELRGRIAESQLPAGTRLPSHAELAAEFGVATLTVRQALSRLEEEGLVERKQGSGTFVREPSTPGVLLVDDEPIMRSLLSSHISHSGFRPIEASNPQEAMRMLETDPSVALVLSDVRMPSAADGTEFIRTVRRRWPTLPLAAVTAYPDDLSSLHGTPEFPILIIPKPFRPRQIEEALRFALRSPMGPSQPKEAPTAPDGPARKVTGARRALVIDEAPVRAVLRRLLEAEGVSVTDAASAAEGSAALEQQPFDHLFLNVDLERGLAAMLQIAQSHPRTVLILRTADPRHLLQVVDGPFTTMAGEITPAAIRAALSLRRAV